MIELDEKQVRASFVNASRGETTRLHLPSDLEARPWGDLDYLGWVDPRAPQRGYVVVPTDEGPRGVQLRRNPPSAGRAKMCSWCLTAHPGTGVALMVAPRSGPAGRAGNTLGVDICADLACSLYVRGLRTVPGVLSTPETLSVEDRVARLTRNARAFVARV